jgi:outer membrane protein OmpA-like peptidoglycan-associated protein
MNRVLVFIFLWFTSLHVNSQFRTKTYSISDCEGAMELSRSGEFTLQFTGSTGKREECLAYQELATNFSQNIVWTAFRADYEGLLSIKATCDSSFLQFAIFKGDVETNNCHSIKYGTANLLQFSTGQNSKEIQMNFPNDTASSKALKLLKGDKIYVVLGTEKLRRSFATFTIDYQITDESYVDRMVYDNRTRETNYQTEIILRDSKTKNPVLAGLELKGIKDISAGYYASHLYFGDPAGGKLSIRCDARGYFFKDTTLTISSNKNQNIVIEMEQVTPGRQFRLDNILFVAGTSTISTESLTRLKRLRDFLALNAYIKVEIQGHVFAKGKNNPIDQKLSEQRAKKVMKYLIQNGIDRERLTFVGFGNTKPLYPKPKNSKEEQANRRVEVMIR